MSRRPGCYVCGQLGHLAENCSFSERRCFNCLEPGHESSACEAPRTADAKQCYGCGGKGHIRADCPTPASGAAKACYTCGEQGHRARDCPQNPKPVEAKEAKPAPAAPGTAQPKPKKVKVKSCYTCNQPGHIAKECPQQPMAEAPGSNAAAALTA
ncbi:zinc knuckle domain protein [Moesziomyces antarcticus]|uniref:Zinc knuckle domain protein n=1 Tax=Pseudozyma antarctica TaxID=84753 RepID=A0A081CE26_PSEA2|nr:zinc knuckle domain protein [Moesziomyces antarcticus]GAK64922.1 zinc knuckle domain protein [Moesziomyces antarcticus]